MSDQRPPMERINRRLTAAMKEFGDRTAFVEGASSKTFAEMEAAVGCAEAWLKAHGIETGYRVAALASNRIETVALEWATYRLGGIWIGVPARERNPANLRQVLEDFSPRLLVAEVEAVDLWRDETLLPLGDYKKEIPPPAIFDPSRYRALERTSPASDPASFSVKISSENSIPIVRIRYTSGASGEPKAIAYSAGTSRAILEQIEALLDRELKIEPKPRDLAMIQGLPIVWATGSLIAPVFCRGGKNVLLPRWDLKEFVHAVAAEKLVLAFLTPGLLAKLAAYSEISGGGWAEAPRRFQVLVAGSPLPVSTMRRVRKVLPWTVECYVTLGQTEASFPITWHRVKKADLKQKDRPFVPLGRLAPPYEPSEVEPKTHELRLKGKAVAPVRWARPNNGPGHWEPLHRPHETGDLVEDQGGILHYRGRKGVVPKSGNLPAPEAVEAVVDECPGVERSRLDYCDEKKSVLTVKPQGSGVHEPSLREFFNQRKEDANLPEFKLGEIRFGDVPLTMTGKVSREEKLRSEACADGSSPSAPESKPDSGQADSAKPPQDKPKAQSGNVNSPHNWRSYDFARLGSGPLYFYVGAGLSMGAAGLVGWPEMACLIWLYRTKYELTLWDPPGQTADKLGEYIQDFVAEEDEEGPIFSRKSTNRKALGRAVLLNLMLRYRAPRFELVLPNEANAPKVPKVAEHRPRPGAEPNAEDLVLHSLVWRSRCHGVLTTNYDMLLEHAYSLYQHGAALRSYRYNAHLLRYLLSNPQFVLKLHGDINDVATMQFDPESAWKTGATFRHEYGRQLKEVYNAILQRGHVIYVGCGFKDATIKQLHARPQDPFQDDFQPKSPWREEVPKRNRRVALVPEDFKGDNSSLENAFDEIEFLTYPKDGHHEVREFLEHVVAARSDLEDDWQACAEASHIRLQIFRPTSPALKLQQNLSTELWTCKASEPPGKAKPTRKGAAGQRAGGPPRRHRGQPGPKRPASE